MLGLLFSAVEVARERLNWMLDSAKIRVCFVVDTGPAIRKESLPLLGPCFANQFSRILMFARNEMGSDSVYQVAPGVSAQSARSGE